MEIMGLWEVELFSTFSFKIASGSQLAKKKRVPCPRGYKNPPKKDSNC